jgi:hypothetical protein
LNREPGNDPLNVSLEFFDDNRDDVFLGPEVFYSPLQQDENPAQFRYSDVALRREIERRRVAQEHFTDIPIPIPTSKSLRLLVKDGIVILFNNKLVIHATPITEDYHGYDTDFLYQDPARTVQTMGNPFNDDTGRIEIFDRPEQLGIIDRTRTRRRSFLRTWISSAGPEYIPEGMGIPPDDDLVLMFNNLPDIYFGDLTPYQLYGGEPPIKNNMIPMIPISNFKIVGDPLHPNIKINCDVPFEEIEDENIENQIAKENEFISKLSVKKGGKNKKRNNRKTKKRQTLRKTRKQKHKQKHKQNPKKTRKQKHKQNPKKTKTQTKQKLK